MDRACTKAMWEGIISKLQERVKKWTYRDLNLAGRLILTKTVLQAISTYMMLVFPVPKGILQKIRSIQRDFLWHGTEHKNKSALVAWDKVCNPKGKGSLGLQDPQVTNESYGENIWWILVKDNSVLWTNLWKAKYAPNIKDREIICSWAQGRDQPFGILLGTTSTGSRNTASEK
jgi:hypothetical protein